MNVVQGHQTKGSTMEQIATTAATAIAELGPLAQADARTISPADRDTVSTALKQNPQSNVTEASAISTSAFLARGLWRTPESLDLEHPLMGPHPTD